MLFTMNSKKLLHISFVDDSIVAPKGSTPVAFDDSLVSRAVGDYFDDLIIESFSVYDAGKTVFPDVNDYAGVVIGGSAHFVREADQLIWMEDVIVFIQNAAEMNVPLLGICFGHQLIAHALGGIVGPFYNGRRDFGIVTMGLEKYADQHLLFQDVPAQFDALASHGDYVHELPHGAHVLAKSESCGIEAAEFAPAIYGVQFHPEYTPEIMLDLAKERIVDEASMDRFSAGLSDAPDATRVLKNFVKYVVDR